MTQTTIIFNWPQIVLTILLIISFASNINRDCSKGRATDKIIGCMGSFGLSCMWFFFLYKGGFFAGVTP